MPLKGTKIGQAYIEARIQATGGKDLEDEFEGVEGSLKRRSVKQRKAFEDLMDGIEKRLASADLAFAAKLEFDKEIEKVVNDPRLERIIRGSAQRYGKGFGEDFVEDLKEEIKQRIKADGGLDRLIGSISASGRGKPLPILKDLDKIARALRKSYVDQTIQADKADKARAESFEKSLNQMISGWAKWSQAGKRSVSAQRAALKALDSDLDALAKQFRDIDFDSDIGTRFIQFRNDVTRARTDLSGFFADLDDVGDRVGRGFGKGSRNNFLNFFGSLTGNLTALPGKIARVGSLLRGAFGEIQDVFKNTSGFREFFAGIITKGGEAGSALGRLGSGFAAAGQAAIIVVPVLTLLVSLMSGLLAIVTALAATLTSGLIASLAVLGGTLTTVAVAAGAAVLAFQNLSDAQKDLLSSSFQPLTDEFAKLGAIIATRMIPGIQQFAYHANRVFSGLRPLAADLGRAFGSIAEGFGRILEGPGFAALKESLQRFLPEIVRSLGDAFNQTFGGLSSLLALIMPYIVDFANWLEEISTRFNNFAASASGRNSISDFFARAVDSARSLGHFISEVSGLLFDLLFNAKGQETGNNLFDSMADSIERFRNYIADGGLEKWFDDAKVLADGLGRAIEGIFTVINALDQSGAIDAISVGFEIFGKVMEDLEPLISVIGSAFEVLGGVLDLFQGDLDGAYRAFRGFVIGIGSAVDLLIEPIQRLSGILGSFGIEFAKDFADFDVSNWLDGMLPANAVENAAKAKGTDTGKKAGGNWFTAVLDGIDAAANDAIPRVPKKAEKAADAVMTAYGKALLRRADRLLGRADDSKSISATLRDLTKEMQKAVREASRSIDPDAVTSGLESLADKYVAAAESFVSKARSAVESAVSGLNSAVKSGTQKEVSAAERELAKANKQLAKALAASRRTDRVQKILDKQGTLTKLITPVMGNSGQIIGAAWAALAEGLKVQNATLADYAKAREKVAERLESARDALEDAINLRDSFKSQISDTVKSYGSLLTAQAKTIDGVVQELTANDIVDNLQQKLDQIRQFSDNLNILLARGLSEDVYKTLVEAGPEAGAAYVNALVNGGVGAVGAVNDLTEAINKEADALGSAAANRLYQAGVDTAQGFVDGLQALDDELADAASALGKKIAAAIKKELGIRSPSKVMIDMMADVGSGIVQGLDDAVAAVSKAAANLGSKISVNLAQPDAPRTSPATNTSSGKVIDMSGWQIHTDTADPEAVAKEVLADVTTKLL